MSEVKGSDIRYMAQTPGWKAVEQEILSRIESAKENLLSAKSMEKVIEHQTKAKTLKSVLFYIKNSGEEGTEEDESND